MIGQSSNTNQQMVQQIQIQDAQAIQQIIQHLKQNIPLERG